MLTLHSGEQRSGQDLVDLVAQSRKIRSLLHSLPPRYPHFVIEQTAIAGALTPDIMSKQDLAEQTAPYIAKRLDLLFDDIERGWTGEPSGDGGLKLWRELRGVRENIEIDAPLIASADARALDAMTEELQEVYLGSATLSYKDKQVKIFSPTALLEAVLDIGRQGFSLQRYKGLGEMNPDQLWQTTLDSNARSLLQVRIKDVAESNGLFEQLMGDVVEPRRQFIQDNALSVSNLDI